MWTFQRFLSFFFYAIPLFSYGDIHKVDNMFFVVFFMFCFYTILLFLQLLSCLSPISSLYWFQTGGREEDMKYFLERNEYIDIILTDVLKHAGQRRIILHSFDPDICTMFVLTYLLYRAYKR